MYVSQVRCSLWVFLMLAQRSSDLRLCHLVSYLLLFRSGWKLDIDGKWVKDENAEFDSDEDEPPEFKD